jgi:hypothetical protein
MRLTRDEFFSRLTHHLAHHVASEIEDEVR